MSNPGEFSYYNNPSSRSRRASPSAADANASYFSTSGQGGRPVLPPIRSAFPTSPSTTSPSPVPIVPYTSERAHHQGSYEYGSHSYAPSDWVPAPSGGAHVPQASSFYDQHARYPGQSYYPAYPARPGSGVTPDPHSLRAYPGAPVSPPIPTGARDDRYPTYSDNPMGTGGNYGIYNPPGSYSGSAYTYYPPPAHQSPSYSYAPAPDPRSTSQAAYINPSHQGPASASLHAGSSHMPTVPQEEEPVIKKKRKRADANQLKVLNETYARTPFPSTEERQDLARRLDMSARSVQIWFQNKRQSMRQGGRSSTSVAATTLSVHHPSHGPSSFQAEVVPSVPGLSSIPRSYGTPPMVRPPTVPSPPYTTRLRSPQPEVPLRTPSRISRSPPTQTSHRR
ncbi:homeobox-domain-containing protein [Punctularia strigosozonata HHB-11173 SS5]|uniref:homeobox-domain-containing protein n=1 Tax=Punctularia strigosozonata (strain HHB-11173) TaxID=741275 RepID=UPI00044179ED|nr:homeobox-domain-containing protein [Punctularia strigosozonata HHB-11173 SS5]EIN11834.1 homeobox-domain-containing protein [Punctularia strigosozonata HHB-11173 SS5]